MIILMPIVAATQELPPAPPPPPMPVPDAPGYVAKCQVMLEADKTIFPVTITVKPKGAERRVEVVSGAPAAVPSGKGQTRGVNRYVGFPQPSLREGFRVDTASGANFVHSWTEGATESKLSITYLKMNEVIRPLGAGACQMSGNRK